jgi:hypothetical protein
MKPHRPALATLCALIAVAGLTLAWKQHLELIGLRARRP